ncbi:hypothetical protein [Candidatus Electronema sp. JC]|jgi:hypothetical protein|uniref:hypothetical protein n=1 Tax=Candidatus Electronema sp. JC TaxID=3401570 RepID=UPI003AA8C53D
MRQLLEQFARQDGVIGAFVFDKKEGVLGCAAAHGRLAPGLLETAGAHLLRLFQLSSMSGLSIKTAQFLFDRCAVVGLPLQANSALIAVCAPEADGTAVAAAAVRLADELRRGKLPEEPAEPAPPVEALAAAQSEPETGANGLFPAQLQAMLCRIEQALAGAVGPVAGMVMQDYIEQWQRSGPAVPSRIVELTNLLVEEIGDPEAAQDFVAKIEQII